MDAVSLQLTAPTAAETPESKRAGRVQDAAQQFEALMIQQMMKTTRETNSDGWLSDGGETGEESMTDMAEAQFAKAMASQGGLGLAKMIVKAMTPHTTSAGPATEAPATSNSADSPKL